MGSWTLLFILILTSCIAAQDKRDGNNATTSGVNSLCSSAEPLSCVNDELLGGFGNDVQPQSIPVSFVFIGSSSESLTINPDGDADRIINALNQEFNSQGHQHLLFSRLGSSEQVSSDLYTNTDCSGDAFDDILNAYGKIGSLTFLLVNDLADSCRGVAKLWAGPDSRVSGMMLEYNSNIEASVHVYAHEIGHNMGLHHSARTYTGSVPGIIETGLNSFNDLLRFEFISMGSDLYNRRCASSFPYYIHNQGQSTNAEVDGYRFNSYQNTMYPSYGDGITRSFFSEGYEGSSSRAFDCWYNLVKD